MELHDDRLSDEQIAELREMHNTLEELLKRAARLPKSRDLNRLRNAIEEASSWADATVQRGVIEKEWWEER